MTWIICCKELMLKLDEHNITIDQVPPNRALFVQPHFPVRAGPCLVYRCAFYGYHQRGEIMHARYPGSVGGDNIDIQSYLPGSPCEGQSLWTMQWSVAMLWQVSGGHVDTQNSVSVVP